jgi:hypothetical protein
VTESIEERLRAHYAAGAVDGDNTEAALHRIEEGARDRRVRRDVRRTVIAVTAVAASIAALAVVLDGDDDTSVDTVSEPTTTVVVPTTTAPAVTSTTGATTTTSAGPPATGVDRAFVAFELGVLGAWDGGAWRQPMEADEADLDGMEFSLVRLDEPILTASAAPALACELAEGSIVVDLPWPATSGPLDAPAIAVTGVPDPRPRPVTVLDPASEAYRDAAEPVLEQIGVSDDDPDIVQLVRTDLEGDGVDEVFGVVERLSNPENLNGRPGDYSAAFLRRVNRDDTVETVVIDFHMHDGEQNVYVNVFRISALVDANGDGAMELALSGRYYEGVSMTLYDLGAGHPPQQALEAGCGA